MGNATRKTKRRERKGKGDGREFGRRRSRGGDMASRGIPGSIWVSWLDMEKGRFRKGKTHEKSKSVFVLVLLQRTYVRVLQNPLVLIIDIHLYSRLGALAQRATGMRSLVVSANFKSQRAALLGSSREEEQAL